MTDTTLATDGISLDRRLRALAAVADRVADLHALGLVHSRLDEHQVVLDPCGRPTLRGLETASRTGDPDGDRSFVRPSLDVAALGKMLDRLIAVAPDGQGQPTPARRLQSRPRRRRAARPPAPRRGDLRQLIDHATRADPAGRPTARRFGAQLQYLCGPVSTKSRPGRAVVVAGTVVTGLALLGLGLTHLALVAAGPPTDRIPPAPATPDQTAADEASPDGTLIVDGHRYAVGAADDRVLVADWGCNGQLAAVVVRPSGAVFRFDGWARPGHDLVGLPVGSWPAATDVAIGQDRAGCAVLSSTGSDPTVTLAPEPAAGTTPLRRSSPS